MTSMAGRRGARTLAGALARGLAERNSCMSSCITFLSVVKEFGYGCDDCHILFIKTIKWKPHNTNGSGVIIFCTITFSIIKASPSLALKPIMYDTGGDG